MFITSINDLVKREATGEGGLITGTNPTTFTTSDPLRLWIVQVGFIMTTSQLLYIALRRLRQPKVIAEVLGGVLLGPTALGRIPGFTENIFPPVSLPYLSLTADIGLCLFLFLVGLEIDMNIVKRNARMSALVSFAGIALPFGFGSALSVPLYHKFIDPSVQLTYFMLFTGVAYSITAFPILCRILTELKLLDMPIGIIVLSAGVGNDIVGWTLLALSVALVNAGSGLTALWILLICVVFAIVLLFPVKLGMRWLARKTGSVENGPTLFYMTVVMLLIWGCGFFTDSIGVNAIFGAFLAGLIIPRDGGLAISLTEKLEDVVSILFLPIYFTLSGLNTDLGLLNDGITWAFTIAIIILSFCGKFGGCSIVCRAVGYGWRESCTIGALMSCKGLIELIVLNIGLQAGIISTRVFSMFVLEALVLTCLTNPLVSVLYPPERRVQAPGTAPQVRRGDERGQQDDKASVINEEQPWRHRFTVVLDKLDHLPSAMAFTQLVLPARTSPSDVTSITMTADTLDKPNMPEVSVEALELIELSDRTSAMMKSSAVDSLVHMDPILGIFRMFGELNELAVTASLSVVPHDEFAMSVAEHAQRHSSHLILLPWLQPVSHTPPVVDALADACGACGRSDDTTATAAPSNVARVDHNPFSALFGHVPGSKTDRSPSTFHAQFVRGVFARSKTDVALFIDNGDRSAVGVKGPLHVFLPFFGGPDDRLALELVVQLCLNPKMTATVVRIARREGGADAARQGSEQPPVAHHEDRLSVSRLMEPTALNDTLVTSTIASSDTAYGQPTTQTRLRSETADKIAWAKYATTNACTGVNDADGDDTPGLRHALSRIHFSDAHTPAPVHAAVRQAQAIQEKSLRLLVVAGRSKRLARENHKEEMKLLSEMHRPAAVALQGMREIIGDVGAAIVVAASASAVVVVQAAKTGLD